jgi:hypothetical protein
MWSLLVDALSLALLAVGGVLTAVRVALWAALFLRGSEPPPAPRNTPLRRTKGEGDPPPPKNERTRPRDDGDALKRYATVARERRGYAALVTATFLMALVLGGCGFLPPAVRTTHIQTPTLSGENARIEATEVGGVISDVRTFVPPRSIQDCARYLEEAFTPQQAQTSVHPQTAYWMNMWRYQARLMCLQQQRGGAGMGMVGPGMLGMGAFPGGLRYKAGGER